MIEIETYRVDLDQTQDGGGEAYPSRVDEVNPKTMRTPGVVPPAPHHHLHYYSSFHALQRRGTFLA